MLLSSACMCSGTGRGAHAPCVLAQGQAVEGWGAMLLSSACVCSGTGRGRRGAAGGTQGRREQGHCVPESLPSSSAPRALISCFAQRQKGRGGLWGKAGGSVPGALLRTFLVRSAA